MRGLVEVKSRHGSSAPAVQPEGTPREIRTGAGALEFVALAGIVALALALRLELLTTRSLWHDEAFSLAVARRPAAYILKHLPAADPHPPGYYLLLRATILLFGDSLTAARGLSAALGVLAVVLTWWVGRELGDPGTGLAAAALVALNPFQVHASNEIRMYPLATCLALVSVWAAWRASCSRGLLRFVAYGASLAAMAYTSYYTVVVGAGQALWLAQRRQWRGMLLAFGAALLLYAPWLARMRFQSPDIVFLREPLRWAHVPELFTTQAYGGYLFGTTAYLATGGFDPGQHMLLVAPFLLLGLAGAAAWWVARRSALLLVAPVWLVAFLGWLGASLILGHLAAYPRHLVFVQPFLAMLLGAGLVHLREVVGRFPKVVVSGAAGLLVLSFLWPAVNNAQGNPTYQGYRYDLAASLVRRLSRPDDAFVFYQGGAQRVFREYLHIRGLQIAIDAPRHRWTREGMRPVLQQAVQPLRQVRGRVWVVVVKPFPPDSPLDLLQAMEDLGYRQVTRQLYQGVALVLLARPGQR